MNHPVAREIESNYPNPIAHLPGEYTRGDAVSEHIRELFGAVSGISRAYPYLHDLKLWTKKPRIGGCGLPDFALLFCEYAQSCLHTQDWDELPFDVSEEDKPAWREHYGFTSIEELRGLQQSILDEFLEQAAKAPAQVVDLILEGTGRLLSRLRESLDKPFDTWYAPYFCFKDDGVSPLLDIKFESELDEEEASRIYQPMCEYDLLYFTVYTLRQVPGLFGSGDESATELLDTPLYKQLRRVDIEQIEADLKSLEPRLRQLCEYLASIRFYSLKNYGGPRCLWWNNIADMAKQPVLPKEQTR